MEVSQARPCRLSSSHGRDGTGQFFGDDPGGERCLAASCRARGACCHEHAPDTLPRTRRLGRGQLEVSGGAADGACAVTVLTDGRYQCRQRPEVCWYLLTFAPVPNGAARG